VTLSSRFIIITLGWCLISGGFDLASLLAGAVIALVVQLMLFGWSRDLFRRIRSGVHLVGIVAWDLVASSCRIAIDVLRPQPRLSPRLVTLETDLRGPGVISVFANAISLTPGSLTLEADAEHGHLLVHLCYGDEAEVWVNNLRRGVGRDLALSLANNPRGQRPSGMVEVIS
jgi:multicomponent Na+:H+ antiporter subunit E